MRAEHGSVAFCELPDCWNQISNLSMERTTPNQLSHDCQGSFFFFFCHYRDIVHKKLAIYFLFIDCLVVK